MRDPFTRDRARVLHSWGLRRLADKTQVLLPGDSDFPRTRLTHTLEVAQISREMGAELGCDPDLTDTAGLCHDLGHPPFGHNGEAALNEVAVDIGGFEGNAQSFRLLTRLEPKVIVGDVSFGLNLTRSSLDSLLKYPWSRRVGTAKFNVYDDDESAFDWVRTGAPGERRCLEAQVMDWADDVAYSVHDVEDALYSGFVTGAQLRADDQFDAVLAVALQDYAGQLTAEDLLAAHRRLSALPFWPTEFSGSARSLAELKTTTSALIGRFSQSALAATRAEFGDGPLGRYDADLLVPVDMRAEVAVLKSLASHYVFHRPGVDVLYAEQRQLLTELVDVLAAARGQVLHPIFAAAYAEADDDAGRLRAVIDQVASLTDVSAVRWHNRLVRPAK